MNASVVDEPFVKSAGTAGLPDLKVLRPTDHPYFRPLRHLPPRP
jgi:hypothetical protein